MYNVRQLHSIVKVEEAVSSPLTTFNAHFALVYDDFNRKNNFGINYTL